MKEAVGLSCHPRLLYALGVIGLYVLSLIVTAPAGLVEWAMPRLTRDRIFLEQAEGGLWHGKAQNLTVKTADGELRSMGRVNWDVLLLPLLKLELAVNMNVADGQNESSGIIAVGFGRFHLRQLKAALPAFFLIELDPAWRTWKPEGTLKLSADDFTVGRQGVDGLAELEWRNAALSLSQVNPLGDYRLGIQGGQKAAQLTVSTLSGVLRFAGKGEWSADNGLNFHGTAQSDPSKKAELKDFLALLGSDQGNDVYQINISNVKSRK